MNILKNTASAGFIAASLIALAALAAAFPSPVAAQSGLSIVGGPVCSPSTQAARVNDFVSFSASGGSGAYYWIAANAAPATGSGPSFGTRFTAPGTQMVTLTANGMNSYCFVLVQGTGTVLGVADVNTGPEDAALWALALGLAGAMGACAFLMKRRYI